MTTTIKYYFLADGWATAYDLDNGDAVIDFARYADRQRVAQITVCYDNGDDPAWAEIDRDLSDCCDRTIKDRLTDPFAWEDGMGGDPFDPEHWTDFGEPEIPYLTVEVAHSHWVEGSGWSYADSYAGIDCQDARADDALGWTAKDFADLITDGMDDDALRNWADDSESDDLYTYRLYDDDDNVVQELEIWASKAAQWRLGEIDRVPVVD